MKKIISFSLWGENPKYCIGALRNAELAAIHYPDWKCRFYIGSITDSGTNDGVKIGGGFDKTIFELRQMPNVEVCGLNEPIGWHGMFWRFYPASEEDVDVFISRDCDSRLSAREAAAVQEWLWSNKLVHSMADHPYHFHPKAALMGGMFGMKKHACPQMKTLIEQFKAQYADAWQCDQDFLRDRVFPLVAHKVYPTSDMHSMCVSFPFPRTDGSFVGEIIGPNEEILHPEHRVIRDQA